MDTYAPFLFHPETGEPMDTNQFCSHFVEAVDKEAGKRHTLTSRADLIVEKNDRPCPNYCLVTSYEGQCQGSILGWTWF
jgi:hypothetical protein